MNPRKFFICEHCGNIVGMIHDSGVPMVCCGEKMKKLDANTVDASFEKHVPVVEISGDEVRVNVGAAEHPMAQEHFIQWVYLQTENGGQRKKLTPGSKPEARFILADDKPLAAFAYCNLHSLWLTEL